MLYTFFGDNIEKIRERSNALVDALKEKRKDASFFRLHHENFEEGKLTELLTSQGLFSSKYIVSIDNILTGISERKIETTGGKSPADLVIEQISEIKKSPHVWIIVEDSLFGQSSGKELGVKLTKEIDELRKVLEKNSDKIEFHDLSGSTAKRQGGQRSFSAGGFGKSRGQGAEINSFAFTDAFFNKDKSTAVFALHQLFDKNTAPEEIHGALWWQTKIAFQVLKKDKKSVSPFVVGKTERFLKKWDETELCSVSDKIVEIYHEAHLGKTDLKDGLFRLVFAL